MDGTIGGSYFSLLFLVSRLDRKRFIPFVVFHREHALMDRFEEAGIETEIIPPPEPVTWGLKQAEGLGSKWMLPVVLARKAINLFRTFVWDALKIARWLRNRNVDLLHLNNSVTRNHSWMLAARLIGIPCITHERGINTHYSRLARYFAPRLSKVICISKAVRDHLITHGVSKNNLVVIYNGIDSDLYQPSRSAIELKSELRIAESARVIGMVGNIRSWKGQDVVIKAIGHLKARYPEIICLFVGDATEADRPYQEYLQRLAVDLTVAENLVFTGYQKEVADFISIMDVLVHASVDPEPFGRVLIEAMGQGKPVVGAGAGAVPEILIAPECGLTYPPGDDDALAEAIDQLLTNRSVAMEMGAASRRRVIDEFGLDRNVSETQRIYTDILEERVGVGS
ncbi:MAG: glycosyltransferase family 4 protein [Pseudomonadota bacterium]|nr:MAG: glycosyltransferase family 4 protein [Pseudomonadota bacterium]